MDFSTMPALGRNGTVNLARKISGNVISGFRNVDSTASFTVGQIGKLAADGNGNPVVTVCTDTSTDIPVGIFWCHKTVSFYTAKVNESVTFTGANSTVSLSKAYLKGSAGTYVKVTDSTGATPYTYTTDYTINYTNGTISQVSTGSIGTTATVLVTYLYKDVNQSGIDQTLGAGKVVLLEDKGEIATRLYDTSVKWALTGNDAIVVCNADGIVTTKTKASSAPVVGKVTKIPTASDTELCFKFSL